MPDPSLRSKRLSTTKLLHTEACVQSYKTELIHRRAPWKTRESVELATLKWVAWYDNCRLMEPLGYIPPAEAEAHYYRQLRSAADMPALT